MKALKRIISSLTKHAQAHTRTHGRKTPTHASTHSCMFARSCFAGFSSKVCAIALYIPP